MNERKLEAACMAAIEAGCARAHLWKIHTETEGGRPDLEVAWNGHTSKLEFKRLLEGETVHDKWEDNRQLITMVRYEQQTARAWIVCYRHGRGVVNEETIIYRPTALLDKKLPEPAREGGLMGRVLWERGAIRYDGVRHDAVVELIRATHI